MVVRRWIGSSVNGLLPTAQVGGEIVRADLLSRVGVAGPAAAASVVVDLTAGLATQLAFVLCGIGLLVAAGAGAHGSSTWAQVLASLVCWSSVSSCSSAVDCSFGSPAWSSAPRAVGSGGVWSVARLRWTAR
jgi:hypothetical protein